MVQCWGSATAWISSSTLPKTCVRCSGCNRTAWPSTGRGSCAPASRGDHCCGCWRCALTPTCAPHTSNHATRVRSDRSGLFADAAFWMTGGHATTGGGAPPAAQVTCAGGARTVAVLRDDPAAQVGAGVGLAAVAVGAAIAATEVRGGGRAAAVTVLGDHALGQIARDAAGRPIAVADVHASVAIVAAVGVGLRQRRKADHAQQGDRKSTRLNSSHSQISYALFCFKKKKKKEEQIVC